MSDLAVRPDATAEKDELSRPDRYFNRELSWLDFNDRVLQLAEDEATPLLERLKFCAIWSSNLDEFFMVRVAGLHDMVDAGLDAPAKDGLTASQTIERIRSVVAGQHLRVCRCLHRVLLPALHEHGIRIVSLDDVSAADRRGIEERFMRQVFPVLTPLAVGLGRPFPYISNLSLSLAVLVRDPQTQQEIFARVKVPKEMLPRFMPVDGGTTFVPVEEVIAAHLGRLFPGMEILEYSMFRVTRDADFTVGDEADDLLQAVETELRRRRFGEVVRLEVQAGMPEAVRSQLVEALGAEAGDVFAVEGLMDLTDLWDLYRLPGMAELRDPPWQSVTQPRLTPEVNEEPNVMAAMRRGDILVHHPYDSFTTSVSALLEQAVNDDDVLAIKLTVYRTSDDTPLMPALIRASERGKQAVCMVELKARFDEQANVRWARKLEEAGVHVVYGLPTLKTHAKSILIVRREGEGVRHYVHVGTGNYHPKTARLYTDFGLLTCDEAIGADVADMFNGLTGFARQRGYRKVAVAPAFLRERILREIDETVTAHREGRPARIAMKMNALVDGACIRALYSASAAGVPVDLNVRGICCLRPGLPGVSENIRVVSIVDRFLEHSRIYGFQRGDDWSVLIGSADLMPRNLDTRVELLAPVEEPALIDQLLDTLERCFADNTHAWDLGAEGEWMRRTPGDDPPRSVQRELMARHAEHAV
ncbi:MAG: polyphosphate kinase [Solirubrobacteraceae bacterium]|nr:polyphosphate kinase [Solirubrobacteraceae bacterium]